jgi:3-methyladenine DNA glycosylase/8-oxoguanine DNA glycosylase
MSPIRLTFDPGRPVPVAEILAQQFHGSGDPTVARTTAGIFRTFRTPEGTVTVLFQEPGSAVRASLWGPGGEWMAARVPALLGAQDSVHGFTPPHPVIERAWREHRNWRLGRSELVLDALIPAIIEQRVTGRQAFGSYRRLVRSFGEPAPGPQSILPDGLMVQPSVRAWRSIPSWQWLRLGVDAQRADTVQRALVVADRLAVCPAMDRESAWKCLRSVPGIGVWTAAEVMQRACGDADAVSFGDYHVANQIGHALLGRPVDDHELERLLEPYRGHRYRVQYLVAAAHLGRERRGPRMELPSHLPH